MTTPLNPLQHRAHVAEIFASLPAHLQAEAFYIIENWPRLIHALARAGELEAPKTAPIALIIEENAA